MSGTLKIYLKPRERIFINGAVIRADRKVALEFMNDVSFLLESHVIQEEEVTTPLRQLYFIVQSMLMEPQTHQTARSLYGNAYRRSLSTFRNRDILEGLVAVNLSVEANRTYDALKKLRCLFPLEHEILTALQQDPQSQDCISS